MTVTVIYVSAVHRQPAGKGQHQGKKHERIKQGAVLGVFVFIMQWETPNSNGGTGILGYRKLEKVTNV